MVYLKKSFVAFGILQKTYFLIFSGFAICNSARWRHPVTRHAAGENSNCNLARASTLKLMCLKIGSFLMQDSSNFMERRKDVGLNRIQKALRTNRICFSNSFSIDISGFSMGKRKVLLNFLERAFKRRSLTPNGFYTYYYNCSFDVSYPFNQYQVDKNQSCL